MTAPVIAALELAEDAVQAVLAALSPAGNAAWGLAPVGTVGRLLATPALTRYYVAQHQDDGGQRDRYIHSDGWAGLVVVRVLSASDAAARAGFVLATAAMAALSSPAGYAIRARWSKPVAIPPDGDHIHTRASLWRVTIRRIGT